MESYVAKFISDKMPIIGAIKTIVPIWRFQIFYPRMFFDEIANSDRLSTQNALAFCLGSATAIVAAVVSIYSAIVIIVKLTGQKSELEEIGVATWGFLEVVAFIYILLGAIPGAVFSYFSSLCVLKFVSFKRMLITSLYITASLLTVGFCLDFVGAIIILSTSKIPLRFFAKTELFSRIFFIDISRYDIKDISPLGVWRMVAQVWYLFVSPAISASVTAYVARISGENLCLGAFSLSYTTSRAD